MPYLALTRAGVASFLQHGASSGSLWIGSDVISPPEISALRGRGVDLSDFVHPVRTGADIEDALTTLREHHPDQPVWVEAMPSVCNPHSADAGQAFLWREFIVGVNYRHNEFVAVTAGPNEGMRGFLIALVALEPEPTFLLEAEAGRDYSVGQSVLVHAEP